LLTQSVTYPVPRHTIETYGQDWTAMKNIVTNGPFRLENWQRDEWMIFTRNPTYHDRLPGNVEKVKLFFFGSSWDIPGIDTKLLTQYKSSTLDVVNLWDLVDQARQQHAAEYVSFPNFMINQVNLNVIRPPFNDVRVRRAFALATDQKKLADEVFKGLFTPARGGFVPPGMQAHSAEIGLPFDPVEARRLLADTGYPEGHHFPKITGIGGRRQAIENLQAQWQENLGIKVEWKFDWTPHKETARRNPPHLRVDGWIADYPDPDNFLRVMFQQFPSTWHKPAYEKLIEKARRLTNQEMRIELYRQADRILVEDVPSIPLVYIRLHYLVKPWVQKYFISPTQAEFWKEVIIEPH